MFNLNKISLLRLTIYLFYIKIFIFLLRLFKGTTPPADGSTDKVVGEPLFFEEVWFIALMVVLGVLLLLVLLACCIRNCGKSNPYIRERLPLQGQQHKQPLSYITDSNDRSFFAMVTILLFYNQLITATTDN